MKKFLILLSLPVCLMFFAASCEIDEVKVTDIYQDISDSVYYELDNELHDIRQVFQLNDGTALVSFNQILMKRSNGQEIVKEGSWWVLETCNGNLVTVYGDIFNSRLEKVDELPVEIGGMADYNIGKRKITWVNYENSDAMLFAWSESKGVHSLAFSRVDTAFFLISPLVMGNMIYVVQFYENPLDRSIHYQLLGIDDNMKVVSRRPIQSRVINGNPGYEPELSGNSKASEFYLLSDSLYTLDTKGKIVDAVSANTPPSWSRILSNGYFLSPIKEGPGNYTVGFNIFSDYSCSNMVWSYRQPAETYISDLAVNEGLNGRFIIGTLRKSPRKWIIYSVEPSY